ncbi:hypothetical protein DEJ16_01735 [Curtobacterium sp. MCJR17_055]|uniref:hypothetical protein n=1 Tax=unclassified Curtobacterium TaxID=257496 RepID=UPI000D95BEB5|nr:MULTISPECIES: hypothetical protein [unclassified Curtobacterium]PYY36896.1 hypothetical protein DEI87_04410 [Curtobacterium sp. MCBD17_029]PYY49592.1 hypothetical protein DEI84_07960 [Curtobacterium sp. MCBD17_023]PYY57993.1 hypothetical protein DEJ26_10425 [Curtobacterium sp. MCPF17_015]PYY58443.1 hypothetical protein DEJ16_01735 [Curtobacterium sp. MCJR17_055]WIB16267.1 hypothetical protein DEJ34_03800 [Curtobacterium sp. MCPF17_050]
MADPRDLDDLLAQAEVVDAPPRTARRAISLALVLAGTCVAIAVGALAGFRGLVIAAIWYATLDPTSSGG